jgi:hypothetical protein
VVDQKFFLEPITKLIFLGQINNMTQALGAPAFATEDVVAKLSALRTSDPCIGAWACFRNNISFRHLCRILSAALSDSFTFQGYDY